MWMLWIVLWIIGLVVLAVLVLYILGKRLPEEHVASASVVLSRPRQAVWDVISDIAGHRKWVKGLDDIERLPDRDGCEIWRQRMGRNSFVLVFREKQAPERMVGTIDDDNQFFSGRWEYLLTEEPRGTRVKLTEYGRVRLAIPRAMMEYMMGKDTYLKKHLRDLAAHFGEPDAKIESGR
jgi:uncharacterized protein YndB with AHSA1/START domain